MSLWTRTSRSQICIAFQARVAVETRNQQERKFAQKTQESKEAKLRDLARQARDQRAGIRTTEGGGEWKGRRERRRKRRRKIF